MTRKIAQNIASAMKAGTARKLSKRDFVDRNGAKMTYVLWWTWIVELDLNTGEIRWNTTDFSWSGSRTTRSRIRDLENLL